jgi:hypothetical protein
MGKAGRMWQSRQDTECGDIVGRAWKAEKEQARNGRWAMAKVYIGAWFEFYCTMTINKTDGTGKVLLERWMWKISDVQSSHYGPFKSNKCIKNNKKGIK